MTPDLEGLEISRGELKHLSGLGINRVYRPATFKKLLQEGLKTLLGYGFSLTQLWDTNWDFSSLSNGFGSHSCDRLFRLNY
ncbi:hypothetical protein AB3M80_08215 [Arthrospira platensis BEA 1257B]